MERTLGMAELARPRIKTWHLQEGKKEIDVNFFPRKEYRKKNAFQMKKIFFWGGDWHTRGAREHMGCQGLNLVRHKQGKHPALCTTAPALQMSL